MRVLTQQVSQSLLCARTASERSVSLPSLVESALFWEGQMADK